MDTPGYCSWSNRSIIYETLIPNKLLYLPLQFFHCFVRPYNFSSSVLIELSTHPQYLHCQQVIFFIVDYINCMQAYTLNKSQLTEACFRCLWRVFFLADSHTSRNNTASFSIVLLHFKSSEDLRYNRRSNIKFMCLQRAFFIVQEMES
jgi:hypothetical protein